MPDDIKSWLDPSYAPERDSARAPESRPVDPVEDARRYYMAFTHGLYEPPLSEPRAFAKIAASGIEGSGESLPFREQIQTSFGRHDVSEIRAHVGGRAADAARTLGGKAYALGTDVAFVSAPDLHTAAHEAAHVVQQRAGVTLAAGIDQPDDAYEQHANAVADLVVRGESAESLLARIASSGRGAVATATVQRQATSAPVSAPDLTLPAARRATWDQVEAAATSPEGKAALDIDWLDGKDVPESVRYTIDREFSDYDAGNRARGAATWDAGVKQLDTDFTKAKADLVKATTDRLKSGGLPAKTANVAADSDYKDALKSLTADHDNAKKAAVGAIGAKQDAAMAPGERLETVTSVPDSKKKITRKEGQALNRTNFMSWAMDVIGDADKVKEHFRGITLVEGTSSGAALASNNGMFLAKDAAARFVAARKDFEQAHPGYTFPDTDTAFELRNLHQDRQGLGMLGHALGEAFDFKAPLNPNVAAKMSNAYPIATLGAHDGHEGHSQVNLGKLGDPFQVDDKFEKLGKDSIAAPDVHQDDPLSNLVLDQFQELVKTSDAMQARMAPQMPLLRDARDAYFGLADLKLARAKLAKNKAGMNAFVKQQLGKFKGSDEEKASKVEEIKQDLEQKILANAHDIDAAEQLVKNNLTEAFKSWNVEMQAHVDKDTVVAIKDDAALAALPDAVKELAGLEPQVAMTKLDDFAKSQGMIGLDAMKAANAKTPRSYRIPRTPKDYQALIVTHFDDSKTYQSKEIGELRKWMDRTRDGKAVFGVEGKATADGHRTTSMQAETPSLMQLFEHGFASNDAMPAVDNVPKGRGQLKRVFNPEVAKTLARFGWSPGSTYGDTMHFDFIEGYNAIAKGGRSPHNVNERKYGPKEPPKLATPPAKAAATVAKPSSK